MRKKIIIPADGEMLNLGLTGRAFILEKIPAYSTPEEVPIITGVPDGVSYPAYPRGIFGNNNRPFSDIQIQGTAESAGDEVMIYSTDECLETSFSVLLNSQYKSVPGTTFTKAASDAVQSLSVIDLMNAEGLLPSILYVSVSPTAGTAGIKWAINADPVQGDDALGSTLIASDQPFQVEDISWMLAFRFIAQVNLETPTINFTPEY